MGLPNARREWKNFERPRKNRCRMSPGFVGGVPSVSSGMGIPGHFTRELGSEKSRFRPNFLGSASDFCSLATGGSFRLAGPTFLP
ncbi:hypothetical protein DES53_101286 [Roseimicrobium gellanilyticum]|uniref:Uncharacterized protein n=1 Tax=Roseimicrobium gellanilyticum TaxID=748857 RepID=A0A366HUX8_9BACT|nr:hypothetical protein DES53_101286 [Roseimicrobium gellanilyticum]